MPELMILGWKLGQVILKGQAKTVLYPLNINIESVILQFILSVAQTQN